MENQTAKGRIKEPTDELREMIRQELQAALGGPEDQFPSPPPSSIDQVSRMISGVIALPFNLVGSLLEGVGSALKTAGTQVGKTLKS